MTTDPVVAALKTIAEEAAACRAAFAAAPGAKWAWHCHHEKLVERLTELPENRIRYILACKLQAEQALRLRLFRPVLDNATEAAARETYNATEAAARETYGATVAAAWETYNAAEDAAWKTYDATEAAARETYDAAVDAVHELEYPDCPWDGQTIFPNPNLGVIP